MKLAYRILTVALLLSGSAAQAGTMVQLSSFADLSPDDSYNWAQLAAGGTVDGAQFPAGSLATSTSGRNTVSVQFFHEAIYPGQITVECSATPCSWNGSLPEGDALLTNASGNPSAGLMLFFTHPVMAVGAWVEASSVETPTVPFSGQYMFYVQASETDTFFVPSGESGGPMFVGVRDTSGTGIGWLLLGSLTSGNLVVDTVYTSDAGDTPEPGGLGIAGGFALLAAGAVRRWRASRK